ncbi:hypothetical protein CR513_02262, partial [Mucuna pruriens]
MLDQTKNLYAISINKNVYVRDEVSHVVICYLQGKCDKDFMKL